MWSNWPIYINYIYIQCLHFSSFRYIQITPPKDIIHTHFKEPLVTLMLHPQVWKPTHMNGQKVNSRHVVTADKLPIVNPKSTHSKTLLLGSKKKQTVFWSALKSTWWNAVGGQSSAHSPTLHGTNPYPVIPITLTVTQKEWAFKRNITCTRWLWSWRSVGSC